MSSSCLLFFALLPLACDGGFSTEEATVTCDEEQTRLRDDMTDASYQACIACHEECGDACATVDTVVPTQFTCPSDD